MKIKSCILNIAETLQRRLKQVMTLILYPLPVRNKSSLCKILKSRAEINECTFILHRLGFMPHATNCKAWDFANILPEIGDGNFLDMGSSDSYILKNLVYKKIRGELYGIDLREPNVPVKGVKYITGDLMNTGLPSLHFRNITCLSVIEHGVDFDKFAREVSRLLEEKGKLFVTFDFCEPKVIPPIKMYNLDWRILDVQDVKELITVCEQYNLYLVQDMDWSMGEKVITNGYYSPHPDISYTFGLVTFQKCTPCLQ